MAARTKFGLTWWGQRWISTLEALGAAYANRLPRGRTYARRGTVSDLVVSPGEVKARVAGSRPRPYRVLVQIPVFSDEQWTEITVALAGQVRHAAALLDGRMPDDIDDVLGGCGVSLFPSRRELVTSCSCPDDANPCKHVAAVHYVLAQTFDADPFLLPTLRGRDRDSLLAGLRAARTGTAAPVEDDDEGGTGVELRSLTAAGLFTARGDLDAIPVHPHPPADPTATLRRLGDLPASLAAAGEALADVVERAAEHAWALAIGSPGTDDDPLLDALQARGSATSHELSADLGIPVAEVRAELRDLISAGLVHRTGHARSTRYHA